MASVRRRDPCDPQEFARAACELLPRSRDLGLRATAQGLEILAADEDVLDASLRLLRSSYGESIVCDGVAVRLLAGEPAREPVMAIRISVRPEFSRAIRRELHRRGVSIAEPSGQSRLSTLIMGTAPMARLLGLPARIGTLTRGSAVHWIRLSHYAARG